MECRTCKHFDACKGVDAEYGNYCSHWRMRDIKVGDVIAPTWQRSHKTLRTVEAIDKYGFVVSHIKRDGSKEAYRIPMNAIEDYWGLA